jgi:hypothetical protein
MLHESFVVRTHLGLIAVLTAVQCMCLICEYVAIVCMLIEYISRLLHESAQHFSVLLVMCLSRSFAQLVYL